MDQNRTELMAYREILFYTLKPPHYICLKRLFSIFFIYNMVLVQKKDILYLLFISTNLTKTCFVKINI